MSKYTLTLNEEQAQIISKALDMYSRIGIGQLETVIDHPEIIKRIFDGSAQVESFPSARNLMYPAKKILFGYDTNASAGIYSREVLDCNRVAWDIKKVIDHRISWDKAGNPPERNWSTMMGVSYDDPSQSSEIPLPEFKKVD